MTTVALLFLIGVILLGFEVFLPGGILGGLAGFALQSGVGLAFLDFGVGGGSAALAAAVLLVGLMLYFEFAILPRTKLGRRLFLHSAVSGKSAPGREADLTGATGRTLTALAPTGVVEIEGRRHEAFSRAGFLEVDVAIRVVGADNFRLIVIPEKT